MEKEKPLSETGIKDETKSSAQKKVLVLQTQ